MLANYDVVGKTYSSFSLFRAYARHNRGSLKYFKNHNLHVNVLELPLKTLIYKHYPFQLINNIEFNLLIVIYIRVVI